MTSPIVIEMSEKQEAVISNDGVRLQDHRAYSPQMITSMNLADAILLANAILAFADEPASADEWAIRQMELVTEARWDAINERA